MTSTCLNNTNDAVTTAEAYYAVHNGKNVGVFKSWQETKLNVEGIRNAVYKKFNNVQQAQHFAQYGVSPWKQNLRTMHIFIYQTETTYCIYFDFELSDSMNTKSIIESIPYNWYDKNDESNSMEHKIRKKELTSLLALSRCLEWCSVNEKNNPIIIHFDFFYSYNCVTKWIKTWKSNCWIKKDNTAVDNIPLLQIIDIQKNSLSHVHYHCVHDYHMASGISGFQKAKRDLLQN